MLTDIFEPKTDAEMAVHFDKLINAIDRNLFFDIVLANPHTYFYGPGKLVVNQYHVVKALCNQFEFTIHNDMWMRILASYIVLNYFLDKVSDKLHVKFIWKND